MTAKQYLRQLARLAQHIKILSDELEERRERLTSAAMPPLGEKVQTTPHGDKFADMIAALADKDLQRQEQIYCYEQLRDDIIDEILGLDNDVHQAILYRRYVQQEPLRQIAEELHYEYKYLCRLHGLALINFKITYADKLKE